MNYKVLTYGNDALREKSVPVEQVDGAIRKLARDMLKTMYASSGLGLAAEQVGRRESICVIDTTGTPNAGQEGASTMPLVLINPRVTAERGVQNGQEGCLSFPEVYVNVKRAEEVDLTYMDLKGRECKLTASGLLSRAIQHELDHLNGVLLVDRMSRVQKVAVAGKLKRIRKQAD